MRYFRCSFLRARGRIGLDSTTVFFGPPTAAMLAPCFANVPSSALELYAQQLRDAADQSVSSKLQQFAMRGNAEI